MLRSALGWQVVPVLRRATECAGGSRDSNGATAITAANAERTITRLAIPSKGRMAEDTQALLGVSLLTVPLDPVNSSQQERYSSQQPRDTTIPYH